MLLDDGDDGEQKTRSVFVDILGIASESAYSMNHGIGGLLGPPTREGGRLRACCSMLHSTTAVLPSMHAVGRNGHISVIDARGVTSSKLWRIMRCDRSMGLHVISLLVASVQEEMHAWTEKG